MTQVAASQPLEKPQRPEIQKPPFAGSTLPPAGFSPLEKSVSGRREELLLAPLGKVAEPPVVRRPERVAPGRRPAAAPELEPDLECRVHLDVVASVPAR